MSPLSYISLLMHKLLENATHRRVLMMLRHPCVLSNETLIFHSVCLIRT